MFGALLLKQLQKQQHRAEFCDTVLQSQGVCVPVHSCVLSAFSPWLCGALSAMPAPLAGQRRLIELQSVEACTLRSLVSLLYSGQLHENKEQVLSAAELLGIKLPKDHTEEGNVSIERRRKHRRGDEQNKRNPQRKVEGETEEQDEGMETGTEEEIGAKESGTQTDCRRETDERETQTENVCVGLEQNFETLPHLTGQLTCFTIQESDTFVNATDATLTLQTVPSLPERTASTCDALTLTPETGVRQTVSEPTCVSQVSLYPSDLSFHQTPVPNSPHPPPAHNPYLALDDILLDEAGASAVEGFEQFEGNITGFINFFLEAAQSQSTGQRGRGRPRIRRGAEGERVERKPRARSRGGGAGTGRGSWRQVPVARTGRAVGLVRMGQGGGRVGNKLNARSTVCSVRKYRRRQGREAVLEVGEGRGRGRQSRRGRGGTLAGSEGQGVPPGIRRPRGRPRLRPYPSISRSTCTETLSNQTALGSLDSSLLHTTPLPPVPQTEPGQTMDWFLDDIIAGLSFLPAAPGEVQTHQQGLTSTSSGSSFMKTTNPSMHFSVHQPRQVHQQQPEGEMNDVLERFLSNFEQQVGEGDLDVGQGTSQDQPQHPNSDPWSNTSNKYTQQQPLGSPQREARCHKPNLVQRQQRLALRPRKTQNGQQSERLLERTFKRQKMKMEEFQTQRMTRSQSRKRNLETSHQKPAKRRCKDKNCNASMERIQKPLMRVFGEKRCIYRTASNDRVDQRKPPPSTENRKAITTASLHEEKNRESVKMRRRVKYHGWGDSKRRRRRRRGLGEDSKVRMELVAECSQMGQSSLKKTMSGSYIEVASSAFERMRFLLESQRDKRAEKEMEMVKSRNEKNRRVCSESETVENRTAGVYKSVCGAEVELRCASVTLDHQGNAEKRGTREGEDEESTGSESDQIAAQRLANLPHCHQKLPSPCGCTVPQVTKNLRCLHTPTHRVPLLLDTPTADVPPSVGSSGEDEEVDVLEVSSHASGMVAVPTFVLSGELSTEEEENMEIDVTGVETDSPSC